MTRRPATTARADPRRKYKPTFIRARREALDYSQDELAERAAEALRRSRGPDATLTKQQISRLENGDRGYTQETLEAIAEALACTPASLLDGEFDRSPHDAALLRQVRQMLHERPGGGFAADPSIPPPPVPRKKRR